MIMFLTQKALYSYHKQVTLHKALENYIFTTKLKENNTKVIAHTAVLKSYITCNLHDFADT